MTIRIGAGTPEAMERRVRAAIAQVDSRLTPTFTPMRHRLRSALAQERVVALLAGMFGVLAMILAAIGLYGMTAYSVARRRRELGIRLALGADRRTIVEFVLRRVAVVVFGGIALGVVVSVWASQFVSTLLYGITPRDPVTFAGTVMILAGVGALAGAVPAWRASQMDPAQTLREGQ